MDIIVDTREQAPLEFTTSTGIRVLRETLPVGDYTARYENGTMSEIVIERKSIADLWGSFTGKNYERERAKMMRYKDCGFNKYILAIEGTVFDLRKGYSYWKGGEEHVSKKEGLSMLRQLMSCSHKYGIHLWFCNGRREMAFLVQEYFLAKERLNAKEKLQGKHGEGQVEVAQLSTASPTLPCPLNREDKV